jgi:hypothetical protein
MENPMFKEGAVLAAGHSPKRTALATRKVCQNDEILDRFAPLTSLRPSHICAGPGQWRWRVFSLRFLPLNLGLLNSHSFGGCSRSGPLPQCITLKWHHDECVTMS